MIANRGEIADYRIQFGVTLSVCDESNELPIFATMYSIQLCLLLFSLSVHLCLPSDNSDYVEFDDESDWDESNELNINVTGVPTIHIDEWTKEANSIEITTKNIPIASDDRVLELSAVLKSTIHRIRQHYKKMDIVFLIDSSSSVGKSNFRSELRFVIKFLSDFNVSYNYTRVSIVTFSSQEKIVCNTIMKTSDLKPNTNNKTALCAINPFICSVLFGSFISLAGASC